MDRDEVHNCEIKLRHNPWRNKEKVFIGCGAGFRGDRPRAALKLLESVPELDYLVLECLAERTLADGYKKIMFGGEGYDPRIQEWMSLLLPLAVQRGVCIITNMGAVDTLGAQKAVLGVATDLGLKITVSVAYEIPPSKTEEDSPKHGMNGASTYLGSAPIVHCLEKYNPHVVITSRVADAALFLAPMIYEFGWRQHEFELLAKGALVGHLLECGCQLTGGYFMHPGDEYRDMPFEKLLDISLPFVEIDHRGDVYLSKAEGSGGELSVSTCAQQLLYEIADPSCYITPDVVIDLREVSFHEVSEDRIRCQGAKASNSLLPEKLLQLVPADCGYKGWGEISYGGQGCLRRAQAAEFLVRSWVNETYPGIGDQILSYIIGHDSLKIPTGDEKQIGSNGENTDIRLRMDGLFELEQHANCFYHEFMALYTNGPAGGGGITVGLSKEIILHKQLVERENVFWRTDSDQTNPSDLHPKTSPIDTTRKQSLRKNYTRKTTTPIQPAPSGVKIPLYKVAHSRAGDKSNDINFSLIPHFSSDINRLKKVITQDWVKNAVSPLFYSSTISKDQAIENDLEGVIVEIYEVPGISSLNVVGRNVLDGGVNCSRRIDRHGKTISDLILSQEIVLP
ncbi:propionyl-CoA carboxylase isoform X1 [Carex rostrata]